MAKAASRAQQLAAIVNKAVGADTMVPASHPSLKIQYTSTGLLPFDIALRGGLPRGRFVELYGPYSTLKSYVGLHAIRVIQQSGGVAALADTEHAFDPEWAEACGVDTKNLLYVDGETGEEKLDAVEVLARNGIDLVVFDSIAAMLPQQEASKRLHKEGVQPGRTAALMSLACRKLTAANTNTAFCWINQLREQVGITFGQTEKPTGGRAMGYYASYRVKISPAGRITEDTKMYTGDGYKTLKSQVGQTFRILVEKSKLSAPFTEVIFDFDQKAGTINTTKFLFAQGVQHNIVTNRGSSWTFQGETVVGKDKFLGWLESEPEMMAQLENEVRLANGLEELPRPGKRTLHKKKAAVLKKSR